MNLLLSGVGVEFSFFSISGRIELRIVCKLYLSRVPYELELADLGNRKMTSWNVSSTLQM